MSTGFLVALPSLSSLKHEKRQLAQSLEEIEERYRPYKDMIDGLEGSNLLLQNQASSALSEAEKLSDQYARLLGHQNTKQKIQHVKKLKDENASLKQVCVRSLLLCLSCGLISMYL